MPKDDDRMCKIEIKTELSYVSVSVVNPSVENNLVHDCDKSPYNQTIHLLIQGDIDRVSLLAISSIDCLSPLTCSSYPVVSFEGMGVALDEGEIPFTRAPVDAAIGNAEFFNTMWNESQEVAESIATKLVTELGSIPKLCLEGRAYLRKQNSEEIDVPMRALFEYTKPSLTRHSLESIDEFFLVVFLEEPLSDGFHTLIWNLIKFNVLL